MRCHPIIGILDNNTNEVAGLVRDEPFQTVSAGAAMFGVSKLNIRQIQDPVHCKPAIPVCALTARHKVKRVELAGKTLSEQWNKVITLFNDESSVEQNTTQLSLQRERGH
jgi:hypothetical protein